MGRILAIDYGRKRTGLAVTDELQLIAGPLAAVPTSGLLEVLSKYLREHSVDCIVIGEPRDMKNRPSEAESYIGPFISRLKKTFPAMPLVRTDERFTSLIATRAIRDAGLKKKDRQDKSLVDAVSAVLILQSFLESRTLQRNPF